MARPLGPITFSDSNQLLTHLHSGTIGWITLGIFASFCGCMAVRLPRIGSERFVSRTSLLLVGAAGSARGYAVAVPFASGC
jgi:hypothetical protein